MTRADVGIGQWGCLGSIGGADNHIITSAVGSPHSVDAGKLGFGPFHPRSTRRPVSKDGGHYLAPPPHFGVPWWEHLLCPVSLTVHWACASEVSKCAGVMDSFWGDRPGPRNFRIICSPLLPLPSSVNLWGGRGEPVKGMGSMSRTFVVSCGC